MQVKDQTVNKFVIHLYTSPNLVPQERTCVVQEIHWRNSAMMCHAPLFESTLAQVIFVLIHLFIDILS